jgi:hypothetical protein
MNRPVFVLDPPNKLRGVFGNLHATELHSREEVRSAFCTQSGALWIAPKASGIRLLADSLGYPHKHQCLLIMQPVDLPRLQFLGGLFENVVAGVHLLPAEELSEVLASSNFRDLFIGGVADHQDKVVVLYKGDFTRTLVPFLWFKKGPESPNPDFNEFSVVDFGQTVRLGAYEAASEAILYEFDADFRRRDKKRWLQEDRSFGGALRRLRLQRGFSRSDFPPLNAKEVARIERGEVDKPHAKTLALIAKKLGVRLEEIASY